MDELYLAGLKTYLMINNVPPDGIEGCLFTDKLRYSDMCAKYVSKHKVFAKPIFEAYVVPNYREHYTPKYELLWSDNYEDELYSSIRLYSGKQKYQIMFSTSEVLKELNSILMDYQRDGKVLQLESVGINSFIIRGSL